jgi:hypothetical protein
MTLRRYHYPSSPKWMKILPFLCAAQAALLISGVLLPQFYQNAGVKRNCDEDIDRIDTADCSVLSLSSFAYRPAKAPPSYKEPYSVGKITMRRTCLYNEQAYPNAALPGSCFPYDLSNVSLCPPNSTQCLVTCNCPSKVRRCPSLCIILYFI